MLSTRDFRAAERGVMLPLPGESLGLESFTFEGTASDRAETLGAVAGSEAFDVVLTAMRGAIGVRAVLLEASTGLRGRELTRSDDITARWRSRLPLHLANQTCGLTPYRRGRAGRDLKIE